MSIKSIQLQEMKTLEDYLIHVSIYSVSLRNLMQMHKDALDKGIFDTDEAENANTIIYQLYRAFIAIDDQINLVAQRVPRSLEEISKDVEKITHTKKRKNGTCKTV